MTAFSIPSAGLFRNRMQDLVLWLLAALHLAALASLLLVLGTVTPARAEAPACTGRNLVEKIRRENPARYRTILEDAAKVPNGKGIFWKVEKPGTAPSFLFGTMHVTDPRILALSGPVRRAEAGSATVVIESTEVLDEARARETLAADPELAVFTDGRSIETLLAKQDVAALEDLLQQRGIPLPAVSRMKPWMLMSFIALPACELARRAGNPDFLDRQIARDAETAGKPVKGLETVAEQFSALASIPLETHLEALAESIRLGPAMDDAFETMTALYLSGEIGLIMPLLQSLSPEGSDGQGYAEFEQQVVTKRNHLMAARAAPILSEGSAFVAVGALHLPGSEGLVELLRKEGFAVTRAE